MVLDGLPSSERHRLLCKETKVLEAQGSRYGMANRHGGQLRDLQRVGEDQPKGGSFTTLLDCQCRSCKGC